MEPSRLPSLAAPLPSLLLFCCPQYLAHVTLPTASCVGYQCESVRQLKVLCVSFEVPTWLAATFFPPRWFLPSARAGGACSGSHQPRGKRSGTCLPEPLPPGIQLELTLLASERPWRPGSGAKLGPKCVQKPSHGYLQGLLWFQLLCASFLKLF